MILIGSSELAKCIGSTITFQSASHEISRYTTTELLLSCPLFSRPQHITTHPTYPIHLTHPRLLQSPPKHPKTSRPLSRNSPDLPIQQVRSKRTCRDKMVAFSFTQEGKVLRSSTGPQRATLYIDKVGIYHFTIKDYVIVPSLFSAAAASLPCGKGDIISCTQHQSTEGISCTLLIPPGSVVLRCGCAVA